MTELLPTNSRTRGEDNIVVDITTVQPEAIKILAKDLDPAEHELYDVFGGTHAISEVVQLKRYVKSVRVDGWTDYFRYDDPITVRPLMSKA